MIETDAAVADGVRRAARCAMRTVSSIGLITTVAAARRAPTVDFAAPIDVVRSVAEDIIATGSARHTWLGVEGAGRRRRLAASSINGRRRQPRGTSRTAPSDDVIAAVDGTTRSRRCRRSSCAARPSRRRHDHVGRHRVGVKT